VSFLHHTSVSLPGIMCLWATEIDNLRHVKSRVYKIETVEVFGHAAT